MQKNKTADYGGYLNQQGFVKNAGQFTDEKNDEVPGLLYGTHIGNCGIYITNKGLSYINFKIVGKDLKTITGKNKKADTIINYRYDIERIDITIKGALIQQANAEEAIEPGNKVSYNYYTAFHNEGINGIRPCKEVTFKNIYPNIDWCVQFVNDRTGRKKLKYNFIVRPGGNVHDIELQYSKNVHIQLSDKEELTAQTSLTTFTEQAPVSFFEENKEPVLFKYKLKGQTLKFEGPAKKFDQTVVIDPEVYWATYLPSSQPDNLFQTMLGADIATDNNSNIFVTLYTASKIPFLTIDPGNGAYYQDYAATGQGAMIIMKFNPQGVLLWSSYFSGTAQTVGNLVTTDKDGNVYAMGKITSTYYTNDPRTDFIPLKNSGAYYDPLVKENFIVEFNNDGKLLWSSFFGGNATTYPQDITSDNQGNLYITGWSTPDGFPIINPGNGAYMETGIQPYQLTFISQFDASNKLLWSTHIDGNDYDPYSRVAVDLKGNIYIGANIRSTVYPLFDAGGYFSSNLWGFAITRFNKYRQITWCTGVPPAAYSFNDLAVDDSSNLYTLSGLGTLMKFNENTELVWTQKYIQTKSYFYEHIVYDRSHQVVHILGQMNSSTSDFPTKNTDCKGLFFFDGQNSKYSNAECPIFMTYTLNGSLQYCSLADWPSQYYDYSNFTVDAKGDLVYLFKDIRIPLPGNLLTDPGNGAYFHPEMNNNAQTPFLMKLITSELNVDSVVTLSNGCDSNNIINLTVLCGTAPFKYTWSNGADSSSVKVPAGDYSVTMTDANFLTKIFQFHIPKSTASINSFNADITDAHCNKNDGSLTINSIVGGTAPFTFSLNRTSYNTNPVFNNIDSGKYTVTVKDANGCSEVDTFVIKSIPGPSAFQVLATSASCNKSDGTLLVNNITGGIGPYMYVVNNGNFNIDSTFYNLPPAKIAIAVKDAFGCTFSDSVLITQALPPDSADIIISDDHCSSSLGTVNVGNIYGGIGPFNISLNNNTYTSGTAITNLNSGLYTLYIQDSKNCLLTQQINIANIGGPDSIYFQVHDAICGETNGKLQIGSVHSGASPYVFSVDNQGYQPGILISKIPAGNHSLNVKDNFGCQYAEAFDIKYVKQYGINITPQDTAVCYGQEVFFLLQFENAGEVKNIQWYTGESTPGITLTPLQTTPVTVMITDNNDCIIKDTAYAIISACNSFEKCVAIPSAFTPNGDGINDKIGPVANGCEIKDLLFQVYNRFGQKVFETVDVNKKWDGKIKGTEQPQGVYVYVCSFVSNGNQRSHVKGNFVLIR